MKEAHIDIESFATVDLNKAGVYHYAEDPSFEILLFGVSVDGGPVEVYDLAQGDHIPADLVDALLDPTILKYAHNAAFERICLSRFCWDRGLLPRGIFLDPAGWRCTMVWSAYAGLPLSLRDVGEALELSKGKMEEGKGLIRLFCTPCKPTAMNEGRERILPTDELEKWSLFKAYNQRDVEVEMQIADQLASIPVPDQVWSEYRESELINDRGILVDTELVVSAIRLDTQSQEALVEGLRELTDLENPRSVSQMKEWLQTNGLTFDTLGKKEVEAVIHTAPEPLRTVLLLRSEIAKSSVKKYSAMAAAACADGRLRGMFMFYGASRSGRFCIAEGTPILVKDQQGSIREKPIEDVLLTDMVFDGEQWVQHEGVVYSGDKEVITWDGITATPEHMVFISEKEKLPLGEAKMKGLPIWTGNINTISTIQRKGGEKGVLLNV